MSAADRRIHPRHAFDRAVFCYHDGTRVSGRPIDISIGGMLFSSPEANRVPKGTQMGVIFDRSCGVDPPVYLLGRVVRFQKEPVEGLGLRWLKATTAMEAPHLATFLELLFGISAAMIQPSIEVGQGRLRSTFEFEAFLRAVLDRQRAEHSPAPGPRTNLRDPEAGPIGLITRPEEVEALRVEVVPHDQGHSTARFSPAPQPVAAVPEPVAPPRAADHPVPADVAATLEIGPLRLGVRIIEAGPTSLFVRTLVGPVDLEGVYPLRFSIPVREGEATLVATTRISEVRTGRSDTPPGLELELVDLDEGERRGLFARYLKWLQQSASHARA